MQTNSDSITITKPLVDDREYRYVRLPNGLDALLVQDPTTDKAAAALDVGVGSFSDPKDLPGLAHFLEHLLFMGTEKFPSENEYSQYVIEHGGMSNAFTAAEHTNYHFEVSWTHLKGCLERFSQFFVGPLFSENCKAREIMAVDSENKKNLQSDMWRLYQLEKYLSNPSHPLNKFSTGNYETLGRVPEEKGVDVRQRLIEFYHTHYTAAIMKLVIIGRDNLDTLEAWTREFFTDIPNTHPELATAPPFYTGEAPLRPQDLGKIIKVEPVMDVKVLELTFPVPDQQPLFDTQPHHYYVHLLAHESKGSLLYYLKEKKWATELGCAVSHICKGTDYLFVNIDLTNEGMNHWHDVIDLLFAYIKIVRDAGPQEWIFDEIKRTTKASFLYRQKSKAMPLSSSLAQVLHRPIPREHILDYGVAVKYDEKLITDFGKFLTPENMRAMLASKTLTDLDQTEPWYGTKFSVAPMPKIEVPEEPIKDNLLHLPRVNEFLPDNFDLVRETDSPPSIKQNRPRLLIDTKELRLWHKLDDTFNIPKAHIFVKLVWVDINATEMNLRTAKMFDALINDKLSDYAYYADIAEVNVCLSALSDGFEIEIHGFSEKLNKLLEVVMKTFSEAELSAERFNVIKEQQLRTLSNLLLTDPYQQLYLNSNYLLLENNRSVSERIEKLKEVQFQDVKKLAQNIRSEGMGIEMLVVGNLTSDQARASAEIVQSIAPKISDVSTSPNVTDHPHPTSYVYEPGVQYYHETILSDPENSNSAILIGYMFGEENTVELSAMTTLVCQILKEATFNQLRTKEQLGYVVGSSKKVLPSSNLFVVYCQSEVSTQAVEARVENFIVNVARPLIANLSKEGFQKYVDAVIDLLLERYKNLNDEAESYWRHCNDGSYDFKRNQSVARAVSKISQSEVLEAFDKFVVNPKTRRRVATHLKAKKLPQLDPQLALSRAVGQLVAERKVQVTPDQIQQFMIECKGLTPQQAMQKLGEKLTTIAGLSPQEAQDFVATAVKNSQEILVKSQFPDTSVPVGSKIDDLEKYYSSVKLGHRRVPVESLSAFKAYEEGDSKL